MVISMIFDLAIAFMAVTATATAQQVTFYNSSNCSPDSLTFVYNNSGSNCNPACLQFSPDRFGMSYLGFSNTQSTSIQCFFFLDDNTCRPGGDDYAFLKSEQGCQKIPVPQNNTVYEDSDNMILISCFTGTC